MSTLAAPALPRARQSSLEVLLVTEGTYPFVVGGVSSWCDLLLGGLPDVSWQVLPIVTAGRAKKPLFKLPANARLLPRLEIWSETLPGWKWRGFGRGEFDTSLPATLARALLSWDGSRDSLVDALVYCRQHPDALSHVFRAEESWRLFLDALAPVVSESGETYGPPASFDLVDAAKLFQTLYWIARTAAAETPRADIVHVTAAGWAILPALVDRALHGTPILLTEHGVYVREAYLGAVRRKLSPGDRFVATRLARGLALAAYAAADAVSPVAEANARWERSLGVSPLKIRVIHNGVTIGDAPRPLPGTGTVVSVGRIDALKDVHTMLRTASEVVRRFPSARFLHYGPVSEGEDAYGRSCRLLHEQLGLGDRFKFMGSTSDPKGVLRDADVVIMTSISEALPLSILEAMVEGRPVVSTGVGGVPELVNGCGVVVPPGDVHGLADGVVALLRSPDLAQQLGTAGYEKAVREYTQDTCLGSYSDLLHAVAERSRV